MDLETVLIDFKISLEEEIAFKIFKSAKTLYAKGDAYKKILNAAGLRVGISIREGRNDIIIKRKKGPPRGAFLCTFTCIILASDEEEFENNEYVIATCYAFIEVPHIKKQHVVPMKEVENELISPSRLTPEDTYMLKLISQGKNPWF